MSGPNCPDCGSFDVEKINDETDRCGFCGWEGPTRPRRNLAPETRKRMSEQNRINREKREAGNLFFIRVFLGDTDIDSGTIRAKIGEIIGNQERFKHDNRQNYFFIMLDHKLDSSILKEIESIKGLTRVKLY